MSQNKTMPKKRQGHKTLKAKTVRCCCTNDSLFYKIPWQKNPDRCYYYHMDWGQIDAFMKD